jgi:preprotein translocase subunit YajC
LSTYFSQQTSAPGREGSAPTPAPGQPIQNVPAPAAGEASPNSPFGGITPILFMLLPLLLVFLMMRGQTKKQKQIESSLKTGDTVITQSGLIGKVTEIQERRVRIEIAPGVNVRMLKTALQGLDEGDPKPGDVKDSKDAKDKPVEKKA